ncbi:MAG: N-acetylmuramoyl-L-alanine amidase [Frankiales bacterium]|nr:N-acetylmuramoyl-L-alanine amidase [Frankiales bacterium]
MRRSLAAVAAAVLLACLTGPAASAATADSDSVDPGTGTVYDSTPVTVPLVFPVLGPTSYSDNWLACRSGCARMHMGQDLMGPKMSPLVAAFDGTVTSLSRDGGSGNYVVISSDAGPTAGWSAVYIHVNNDTPGTDDGKGTDAFAFPAGIEVGARVLAGQLVGWRGDSGNAEGTGPHLHFELHQSRGWGGTVRNAFPSLQAARHVTAPTPSGPHPTGTLLRHPSGALFLLDGAVKRPVTPAVLAALGRPVASAVPITSGESLGYRTGPAVPPRDGAVLRDPSGTTWLVTGGSRVRAPLPALAGLGLTAPRVWPVADADLATLPVGDVLPTTPLYPGALLRVAGRLQLVGSDGRLHAVTAAVAGSHGWTTPDVLTLPLELPLDLPGSGEPLGLRDGSLVVAGGVVGVVSAGTFRPLHDSRQVSSYGYAGRPRQVVPADAVTGLRTTALSAW